MKTSAIFHLARVTKVVVEWVQEKYKYGQSKHGGNLNRKPMLEHLAQEYTDGLVYLITHIDQVREATARLDDYIYENTVDLEEGPIFEGDYRVLEAYNLLQYGNIEGETEEELEPNEIILVR
jgi:hypothetical protein